MNEIVDSSTIDNNASSDHANVVACHYNALKEVGLSERNKSKILYMRNFNNWIKSMLINEYMNKIKEKTTYGDPIRVLDMCCGKGGDLLKWDRAKISHLICADIAEISVEQCEKRFQERKKSYTAEFLACDCTKVRLREKYKDASMKLDLVSCQFAFHYCFESLPQAECMLRNASESLKPGGYFIGTMPNAYELVSRWHKAEGNQYMNEIYRIEFQCDKKNPPLFNAKYNFYLEGVVNCPEFLVHPPTFLKLASKFGLELVMLERFDDFFKRMKDSGKTLLNKMEALQTYSFQDKTPSEVEQEFQHVTDYLKNDPKKVPIGTLSKSEWEAITLYSVFAFRKSKTIWSAEGKPEFVKF